MFCDNLRVITLILIKVTVLAQQSDIGFFSWPFIALNINNTNKHYNCVFIKKNC